MTWIQTETISVPAHANQTTVSEAGARTRATVALNEWFFRDHSFLLGNPRANQLRGTAGGWVQTLAIAPQPGQDTIALLRDRLTQILKGNINNEVNHVATVIPADRFESNSPYAFILRENPKAQGVEIHFPPDSTPAPDFIARIAAAGFEKAKSNPHLWYSKYSDELIGKARGWVKACQKHGAYEISSNVPVEQTKSRRRGKSASKPSMLPTAAPAVGNKVVDAVCDRVQAMLLQMKEELTVNNSELDVLRAENERLKAELHSLRQERERLDQVIQSQRDTIDVAVKEVERLSDVVEERDRTITELRSSLAEWGVESPVEDTPVFEDEAPDSPVFDDEPVGEAAPVFDDEDEIEELKKDKGLGV